MIRIESAGEEIDRDTTAVFPQPVRIPHAGKRVVVGDEIERLSFGLQRNGRLNHPEIVTNMESAAWLDPGKNAHFSCNPEGSRGISLLQKLNGAKADSKGLARSLPTHSASRPPAYVPSSQADPFLHFARNNNGIWKTPLGWVGKKIRNISNLRFVI